MAVDEKSWLRRLWMRSRALVAPVLGPFAVVVAIMSGASPDHSHKGLKDVGRNMSDGWKVHWGAR
jgi:hypothetical protein